MKSKVKIQGRCPDCGKQGCIVIGDVRVYWNGELSHIHRNLPCCTNCDYDTIRLRKINNRRYKVHEIQWNEYYENS